MAYTPTEWQTGDIVTAEKLNKLENGVANGSDSVLLVEFDDGVTNKTAGEIKEAYLSGKTVLLLHTSNNDYGDDISYYEMTGYTETPVSVSLTEYVANFTSYGALAADSLDDAMQISD